MTLIQARIEAAQGWIGFDAFMALALYTPGLGYYSGPSRKFGAGGDFVTAPELSPLFGACVAGQLAAWMQAAGTGHLVEFGAGTGQLASQVLNELERLGQPVTRYDIIELSGNLREQQADTLRALSPTQQGKVHWLDRLPDQLQAVVLANEVLDAMPVNLFHWDGRQLFERGVAWSESGPCWQDRPATSDFEALVRRSLTGAGHADLKDLPAPYVSEVHAQGQAWIRTLGGHLQAGAVLTLDYGFPAREYYHGQRDRGTLACHHRHQVGFDPFLQIGAQDLTAHVDFTAIDAAAGEAGLNLAGFCNQARFLMNNGLLERLAAQPIDAGLAYASQAQAVGRLLSEAEMGELFKAIAWVKAEDPAMRQALLDASHGFEPGGRLL